MSGGGFGGAMEVEEAGAGMELPDVNGMGNADPVDLLDYGLLDDWGNKGFDGGMKRSWGGGMRHSFSTGDLQDLATTDTRVSFGRSGTLGRIDETKSGYETNQFGQATDSLNKQWRDPQAGLGSGADMLDLSLEQMEASMALQSSAALAGQYGSDLRNVFKTDALDFGNLDAKAATPVQPHYDGYRDQRGGSAAMGSIGMQSGHPSGHPASQKHVGAGGDTASRVPPAPASASSGARTAYRVPHDSSAPPVTVKQEYSNGSAGMRRVQSTGDLGMVKRFDADNSIRIGKYTLEERQQRIDRFRKKRAQRNFTKKIKYTCRKTLADSRPRVHGRFARHVEPEEQQQKSGSPPTDGSEGSRDTGGSGGKSRVTA